MLGPQYHHPIELGVPSARFDLVRSHAADWHIAPDRHRADGILGGRHLASSASRTQPVVPTPPIRSTGQQPADFVVLGYPVISFVGRGRIRARRRTCWQQPDSCAPRSLSSETHVTATTPPTSSITRTPTRSCGRNAVAYFLALRKAGCSAENTRLSERSARDRSREIRRSPSGRGCSRTGFASVVHE